MTASQRRNFVPDTPVSKVMQRLDLEWEAATRAAWTGITNPINPLQHMGDFVTGVAEESWDKLRDAHAASQMALNVVTRVLQTPCEDNWTVLVETALPAAGEALWILLVPSPSEILENYLAPKSLKSDGRGGRGTRDTRRAEGPDGRKRRRWPVIPDVDSWIADSLPGAEAVQGRDAGRGTRWLFEGIGIADRIAWHWMLLDIATDFFVLWSSGMREARFCSQNWDHLVVTTVNATQVGTPPQGFGWGTFEAEVKNAEVFAPQTMALVSDIGQDVNGTGTVTIGRTIIYESGFRTFTLRARIVGVNLAGQETEWLGPPVTVSQGGSVDVALQVDFVKQHGFQFSIECDPDNFTSTDWSFAAAAYSLFAQTD